MEMEIVVATREVDRHEDRPLTKRELVAPLIMKRGLSSVALLMLRTLPTELATSAGWWCLAGK
jgi:hypothetical protein